MFSSLFEQEELLYYVTYHWSKNLRLKSLGAIYMDNQIISDRHCCEQITSDLLVSVSLYLIYSELATWEKNIDWDYGGKSMEFYMCIGNLN